MSWRASWMRCSPASRIGIANAANAAAAIFHALPDLNWAGFYFLRDTELVLGPFQGRPACVRIALGQGVCGTAAAQRRSILVPDVEAFPGHIACDTASRSELVCRCCAAARCWACSIWTARCSHASTRRTGPGASCSRG